MQYTCSMTINLYLLWDSNCISFFPVISMAAIPPSAQEIFLSGFLRFLRLYPASEKENCSAINLPLLFFLYYARMQRLIRVTLYCDKTVTRVDIMTHSLLSIYIYIIIYLFRNRYPSKVQQEDSCMLKVCGE